MFVVLNILLTARLKMFEVDLKIVLEKQKSRLSAFLGQQCWPSLHAHLNALMSFVWQ